MHGLLGEGGMACVFDAFDERLGRPVAVKVLRPETQALPGMQMRFQREALIAARLVHPNIVSVLDYGQDHSSFFLVMERLPGTTLRDEIARGPLVKQRVLLVVAETLAALAAAHRFGVLHRDIKPSNILLLGDGHTKISDFGIATSLGARTGDDWVHDATTGFVLGTPGYLAPERRSGRRATVQSDLYSVGAVMIETITGKRVGDGTIPTESLPPVLRDIACRALATDPRDRFASAGDMLHALGTSPAFLTRRARAQPVASPADAAPVTPPLASQTTAIPTAPPSIGPAAGRSRRRRRRALSAGVAALTLVAAVCLLLEEFSEPAGLTTGATTHDVARPGTHRTDPETTALEALATSLARAGLSEDRTMASALEASAAQGPGTARRSTAQQALVLARALLDEGGLTSRQYRDVVDLLRPTGATEPVAPITAPTPLFPGTFFQGRDHRHDHE
jgi:eukaryotic-like serine/threonine-protein kinase